MRECDAFLSTTDPVYEDCAKGIAGLDRIVVGSPFILVGQTRAALVPALYAYWERFFRMVMGEFLQSVATVALPPNHLNKSLERLRAKRVIRHRVSKDIYQEMMVAAEESGASGVSLRAQALATEVSGLVGDLASKTCFPQPESWVVTGSNVRFEVVEKNYRAFGLEVEALKQNLADAGYSLYPDLKHLVDTRNSIAHGENTTPLSSTDWNQLREFTVNLMNGLQWNLYHALDSDIHRCTP